MRRREFIAGAAAVVGLIPIAVLPIARGYATGGVFSVKGDQLVAFRATPGEVMCFNFTDHGNNGSKTIVMVETSHG